MDLKDLSSEQIAGGMVSLPFLALLFRKFMTLFKREATDGVAIDARGDVIDLLREEIKRLQEENQRLRRDVDELIEKLRVIRLRSSDRTEIDLIQNGDGDGRRI